jgi:GMP synthase (glutamine-hydrolysing)
VYQGEEAEVGLLPVELTAAADEDPVFADAPSSFSTLQWHGDSFDLPRGATLLASSPAYPNQAFRYGRAYALQFHLEVTPELAAEWGDVPA